MNRLQSELHRLYRDSADANGTAGTPSVPPGNAPPRRRALVIELAAPPSWETLSAVWHGVQSELNLPAPAIAVSGVDSLQLWFSLAEPVGVDRAHRFLDGLRTRFLPDIEPRRVRLRPSPADAAAAPSVPAQQALTGNWSAFVARDLAPVFGDTPWLDIPPGEEGQATLLRSLDVTDQPLFDAALQQLAAGARPLHPLPSPHATSAPAPVRQTPPPVADTGGDAADFLRQVMGDASVPLALRIEAAKALLPHANRASPLQGE